MDTSLALRKKTQKQYGWELQWHARSKHWCKGKLFMGPTDFCWLVYSVIVAIVGCTSAVYSARLYFQPQQPMFKSKADSVHLNCLAICDSQVLFVSFFVAAATGLYNYCACSFSDPGVLLRDRDSERLR
jgi:hypothetical protein